MQCLDLAVFVDSGGISGHSSHFVLAIPPGAQGLCSFICGDLRLVVLGYCALSVTKVDALEGRLDWIQASPNSEVDGAIVFSSP